MKITKLHARKTGLRGFALTEVLLAIAVIVIIGIAAYPLYKNARTSSEVEAMANDIAIIETNAQTLYSGQSSYVGITMDQLDKAGLVPDDLKPLTAAGGVNSWGGAVTIASAPAGVLAKDAGFTIGLTGVPQSACTQLVNRVAPSFIGIGVEAGLGTVKGGTVAAPTTKVALDALATACDPTGTTKGTLYFTAR